MSTCPYVSSQMRAPSSVNDPLALATYVAAVVLSLAFAWLFSLVTERQTFRVRGWLKSRLGRASTPGT